jgi:type IV secretion system protein VirB8
MSDVRVKELETYYAEASRWSEDREAELRNSRKIAWVVAAIVAVVALLEAIALVALAPLKTSVPYLLLVDRQTGFVQALDPLDKSRVAPDSALVHSFLVQYVTAREGFDIDSLRSDYRKVALWSAGDARARYISTMQASNPSSPLSALPRRAVVRVEVQSVTTLGPDSALVRFATVRADPGGQAQPAQRWAAVLNYRFTTEAMSEADRLENPLGFQVVRYRRDAELLPDVVAPGPAAAAPSAAAPSLPQTSVPSASGRTP